MEKWKTWLQIDNPTKVKEKKVYGYRCGGVSKCFFFDCFIFLYKEVCVYCFYQEAKDI